MNEQQRKGLAELSEWRASLASGGSPEPAPVVDRGALPVAAADGEASATAADAGATSTTVADRDEEVDGGPVRSDDREVTDDGESDDEVSRKRRPVVDWLVVMGVALLAAVLIRTYVLAHFVVDGTSMVTTLEDGDRVFVNKLSYRLHDPRRGDVVVLHEIDETAQRDLIKRVIALPGETIEMRSCQVLVNGDLLVEPYLDPAVVRPGNCGDDFAPVIIEADHVFVMGDNRSGSMDSRVLGTIDDDDLVGRAFVVFWPSSNWRWL